MTDQIDFVEKIDYIIKTLTDINNKHVDDTVIMEIKMDNSIEYSAEDAEAIAKAYPNNPDARALSNELSRNGGLSELFDELVVKLEDWEALEDNTPAKDEIWEELAENGRALEENAGGMIPLAEKVKAMLLKEKAKENPGKV